MNKPKLSIFVDRKFPSLWEHGQGSGVTSNAEKEIAVPPYLGHQALVIEPDSDIRSTCKAALEVMGFRVETAESGVTAVMSVLDEIPDIVLLGRELRDVSAKEAIHWLRVQPGLRGTPIIVLDGAPDTDHVFGAPHVFALLQMPATQAAIAEAVAKALAANS